MERRQRRQRRDDEATVREEEIAGNVVSSSRRTDEALTAVSSPQVLTEVNSQAQYTYNVTTAVDYYM